MTDGALGAIMGAGVPDRGREVHLGGITWIVMVSKEEGLVLVRRDPVPGTLADTVERVQTVQMLLTQATIADAGDLALSTEERMRQVIIKQRDGYKDDESWLEHVRLMGERFREILDLHLNIVGVGGSFLVELHELPYDELDGPGG